LHDRKKNKLFDKVSSSQYVKSYLKGIRLPGKEEYREDSSRRRETSTVRTENSYGVRIGLPGGQYCTEQRQYTCRMTEEKGLLRGIQEPEYRTQKITSLVYVV
jgi:hypothetical protein